MSAIELIDRVDQHDCVVEIIPRPEGALSLCYFRAINVFIKNSKGQLWIPRRTAHKKAFPLHLDASAGGVVSAGETYMQAFKRELYEELNIDTSIISFKETAYLSPVKHPISCFMQVYEITMEEVPLFNTHDFCEYYWLTPQEVLAWIRTGEPAKYDLPALIELLYTNNTRERK